MFVAKVSSFDTAVARPVATSVSIVMPCLNEIVSLPHCIANAREALRQIAERYGLPGEIVVADNGSTDGSQACATALGARVVPVAARGYGAALIGGCEASAGDLILMGDADGSYDFTDGVAMIGALLDGADLCMGSRFQGGIAPGAMPWKNRYVGNPLLTGLLNIFFRSGIDDAHCGLRALSRPAFESLGLSGTGMEFASEMVIKASLRGLRIAQVPAKLQVDLRNRPPHLRPWRDGWRHLRYLLMLSPTWAFGVPAAAMLAVSTLILAVALFQSLGLLSLPMTFGAGWTIAAGFLFTIGHMAATMAVACHFEGVRQGYRPLRPLLRRHARFFSLETMLISGGVMLVAAFAALVAIGFYWSASHYAPLPSVLPLVATGIVATTGLQNIFAGFLLAVLAGHRADFGAGVVRAAE